MNTKRLLIALSIAALLTAATVIVWAGNPDGPPGPPETTASYTLQHIYERLEVGAAGAPITFTEPASGPAVGTMHTLDEIMALAPEVDEANGAAASQVVSGTTYWSLRSGAWGPQTGAMPDNGAVTLTPTTTQQTIAAGYHNGSGYVEGDADLAPSNIRCRVTIFGVTGTVPPDCVAQTGQTQCWDSSGAAISCAGTGQDGEYQKGCEPVVEPSYGASLPGYNRTSFTCLDGATGFEDNGDGTVTDNLTGLIWLKDANCLSAQTWANALSAANGLADGSCGLSDGSSAGDWRLPNVNELSSLFDPNLAAPYLPAGHPFQDVQSSAYWSSTTSQYFPDEAGYVSLVNGFVGTVDKGGTGVPIYLWPVRGGQ